VVKQRSFCNEGGGRGGRRRRRRRWMGEEMNHK